MKKKLLVFALLIAMAWMLQISQPVSQHKVNDRICAPMSVIDYMLNIPE